MAKKNKNKRKPKTQKGKRSSTNIHKHIILLIVSLAVVITFYSVPYYNFWLKKRIFNYYKEVSHQLSTLNVEKRLIERHGYNYLIPKYFSQNIPQTDKILVPNRSYIKKYFSQQQFYWGYPVWNYYFFKSKNITIFKDNIDPSLYKYAVICKNRKLKIVKIDSVDILNEVISEYNRGK